MTSSVINIVVAGLGGQGVVTASDILAEAAFRAGYDVKQSEIHGMSQRGGFVTSDVRFGGKVLSPMVPAGEADYLVVLSPDQLEAARGCLRAGGGLITTDGVDVSGLTPRNLNIAALGALSARIDIAPEYWLAAIRSHLPERAHADNLRAFEAGRRSVSPPPAASHP